MGYYVKSKKAQGHIEMILSFILFIGFIGTLLFFLNPINDKKISYTILDITEEAVMKELSFDYSVTSLTLIGDYEKELKDGQCFSASNNLGLTGGLIVFDENQNQKKGDINSGIEIAYSGKFYKLYSSSEFDNTEELSGCKTLDDIDYTYGAFSNYDAVLYEKIEKLINDYKTDYEALRKKLNIQNDFIIFVYDIASGERKVIAEASILIPKIVEVSARDIPVISLNKNVQRKGLVINIQAW